MIAQKDFTVKLPAPAAIRTMYFVGVTTGGSSIQTVFPRWAAELALGEVALVGVDLPLHAPRGAYRKVVDFIACDPLSVGALVTTHKIDLYDACRDMFDEIDPVARLTGETSCLSKRGGRLICHARDTDACGLAMEAFLPDGYWANGRTDAFLLGAGGSATAISLFLTRSVRGADRPARIVVSDVSPQRLRALRKMHEEIGTEVLIEYVHISSAADNDAVLTTLPSRSLVVNATGLGKDLPGSPLTNAAVFPGEAIAWDLNYRGDLRFLHQARTAQVRSEDGWVYFLHGWIQVIGEVFHLKIPTSGPRFRALDRIAAAARR
jgi:shikimate 5-dehydrogenase